MEEDEAPPAAPADSELFASDRYAAEAMAADLEPWVVFDSRKTPRAEFEDWLESNRPSRVSRHGDGDGRGPVGWISVIGPDPRPDTDDDVLGLQESWEQLLASGRPVNFHTVRELALNHGVLSGKWLMYLDTGFKLDRAWECVARAIVDGQIWQAKVSPWDPGSEGDRHVICVYAHDFTDEGELVRLDAAIRAAGVKCRLTFKPDVYTHLGIYRHNPWKLCPTIYESKFNLECVPRRSLIVNRVTKQEVT